MRPSRSRPDHQPRSGALEPSPEPSRRRPGRGARRAGDRRAGHLAVVLGAARAFGAEHGVLCRSPIRRDSKQPWVGALQTPEHLASDVPLQLGEHAGLGLTPQDELLELWPPRASDT